MRKKVTRHCEERSDEAIQKNGSYCKLDCFALKARNDRKGFTLAEVLITLGIIGVVAAIVMPGLIQDWREKSYSTAKEVFNRRLEEATRQMNVNEVLTGYSSTETFVNELKKYMKILQVCPSDPSGCFAAAVTNGDGSETVETKNLKNSSNLNEGNWGTKALGIGLINGYTAILSYNPECSVDDITAPGSQTTSCLSLVYDINGKAKPNKLGKDVYTLNANIFNSCSGIKIGSLCISASNESRTPIDTCSGNTEYDDTGSSNAYCATNYWAGAKKTCADQGMRLPTRSELLSLKGDPATNAGISGYFWSSEPYEGYAYLAWYVYLPGGGQDGGLKRAIIDVRCVR
ncbi:MAG: prepilin-type N-terminal cleavage/methylation domain-containing protein [Heliobacteriaceae bacterium]|jgi:prepilin-type N-terminal cleavage/methylation domain-containing protein|nr:prepilin-type N-terminal cleavage/methylation domain-containing protein [Heliobacteriaceae bacterium]